MITCRICILAPGNVMVSTSSMDQPSGILCAAQLAVEQDAWNAALARARGERILDDPKLLSRCAPPPACLLSHNRFLRTLCMTQDAAARNAWGLSMPSMLVRKVMANSSDSAGSSLRCVGTGH